jgi:aspartate kinase
MSTQSSSQSLDSWIVHKFGGTSVGSSSSIRKCIDIIRPLVSNNRVAVVVSAMGGKPKVTDLLLQSVHHAAKNDMHAAKEKLQGIRVKHIDCVRELFGDDSDGVSEKLLRVIDKDLADVADLLRAVALMRFPHDQILELVSGYGEIWSATLITHAMRREGMEFVFLNARDVLFVSEEGDSGSQKIEWEMSERKLMEHLERSTRGNDGKVPNLLITGYVASTVDGVATTLKRDGSDYSASIFAKMLRASAVTIWTDVSGVYSADPRRVPEALIIPDVSYTEAIELAYFGAKVIHPKTMAPAIMAKIPIYIRNTFAPQDLGTKIANPINAGPDQDLSLRKTNCVCGFSSVDDISLVNMEGSGMIGVPGIAHRLFGALKAASVSVMFIAQASSEYSICFAIKSSAEETAKKAIEEAFFYELNTTNGSNMRFIRECSIIAAVGENMTHMPGVSGVFFGALGNAGVNVLSISQGCDERNISAVVYARDATRALRAVHAAFWLSALGLSIGIVGTGRVGSAVIQSLLEQTAILEKRYQIKVDIRGVINSRNMILGEDLSEVLTEKLARDHASAQERSNPPSRTFSLSGLASEVDGPHEEHPIGNMGGLITPSSKTNSSEVLSEEALAAHNISVDLQSSPRSFSGERPKGLPRSHSNTSLHDLEKAMCETDNESLSPETSDLDSFFKHITAAPTPHCIIIDCTASGDVAMLHPKWLNGGAHIVTANKQAICNDLSTYNSVYKAARLNSRMYMSEVTIGAAIPVKTTLNDLLSSGDAIKSIQAVMSVSVNYVMSSMCEEGLTFSESLQRTHERGIFETNHFEDLSGTESAQKILVLSRELGIPLSYDDIHIEAIAKDRHVQDWKNVANSGEFAAEDAYYAKLVAEAKSRNCTLRYVQKLDLDPAAEIGFDYDVGSCKAYVKLEEIPLTAPHAVQGTIYHFAFHTARYAQSPLVIQGPLSDSMNTASGMVGDILRIARSIGAKNVGPEELGRSRVNSATN